MPEITDRDSFEIQPKDINAKGHFWDAFDNVETEVSARYIVRLCQEKGGWSPFTREEIEKFYQRSGYVNFCFNRLVDPEMVPLSLVRAFAGCREPLVPMGGGWVILGEDGKYRVTEDFIRRCHKSSPAQRQ